MILNFFFKKLIQKISNNKLTINMITPMIPSVSRKPNLLDKISEIGPIINPKFVNVS